MPYASFKDFGKKRTGRVNHETVTINGIRFDSMAEADRYKILRVMEKTGKISDLECHPRWEIIPAQKIEGHRSFQAAHYTADFKYFQDGKMIVEDVKSEYTRQAEDYKLRRKLMMLVHGIYVTEVIM
jgi:hypothetical protein